MFYILSNNLTMFYSCTENLSEDEFKNKELTYLAEEILRQKNSWVWHGCFLLLVVRVSLSIQSKKAHSRER